MMTLVAQVRHSSGGENIIQTILNGIIRGFSWRIGSNIGRGIPFGVCLLIAGGAAALAWYFYRKNK
ncbi:hypothetical protein [Fructobacillus tropaeoli]|uniref:Uncharacterized protein n=1 Tax=Fructobacillus tropaeoli TaxID=709323 RepID=A0A3F3HIJ6_9LACO|nr:hypothetical protein [Fructobacillus tropaeoli]GAP04993.1 hypothetical protein FTRO_0160060 [Fructobacillus tropaeoli]